MSNQEVIVRNNNQQIKKFDATNNAVKFSENMMQVSNNVASALNIGRDIYGLYISLQHAKYLDEDNNRKHKETLKSMENNYKMFKENLNATLQKEMLVLENEMNKAKNNMSPTTIFELYKENFNKLNERIDSNYEDKEMIKFYKDQCNFLLNLLV